MGLELVEHTTAVKMFPTLHGVECFALLEVLASERHDALGNGQTGARFLSSVVNVAMRRCHGVGFQLEEEWLAEGSRPAQWLA